MLKEKVQGALKAICFAANSKDKRTPAYKNTYIHTMHRGLSLLCRRAMVARTYSICPESWQSITFA